MTIRKALPAKLALTDADDTRYVLSGLVACDTSGVPRSGVTSPVGVNLVTATATMNVSVARFQAVAVRDAGVVLLSNDGVASVLLDAAPAANSRIDVIYARQNDSSSTVSAPDANDLPVLTFAKGTAAASPVKPSIPAGSVELATVLIPSTATATNSAGVVITQTAQFTAAAGGVVPFRTKALLDAWTTAPVGAHAEVLLDPVAGNVGVYKRMAAAWSLVGGDTDWLTPTFTNSWVEANSTPEPVRYRRLNGAVYMKGRIALGSTGSAFTLPAGFRPTSLQRYLVPSITGATGVLVTVQPSGAVECTTGTQPNLSQIIFPAS